ncbi:hypothetical protein J2857_004610 [Neorhizobium galegae]|uniref:hypothetical protein n=1 Tax=Neorhizobium galegae TaxID=399 RepID=UPI001AE43367|nr:hypothetical protein [Neorhizobium galegae]MBP2561820.1 hypothetical protein [Neorhizobium galegae]
MDLSSSPQDTYSFLNGQLRITRDEVMQRCAPQKGDIVILRPAGANRLNVRKQAQMVSQRLEMTTPDMSPVLVKSRNPEAALSRRA